MSAYGTYDHRCPSGSCRLPKRAVEGAKVFLVMDDGTALYGQIVGVTNGPLYYAHTMIVRGADGVPSCLDLCEIAQCQVVRDA